LRSRARARRPGIGGGCAKQTDRLEPALRLLATSPFRFSGIVVRRFWFGGDDGARAIGVTADAAVAGAEISYRVIDK
jgi:hypothetical protein